jgi:hypothetical protein
MAAVKEWGLTRSALDRLLGWLDSDPAAAAKKYEHIRRALIKYFESHGCRTPEDQADSAIDRVARRVDEGVEIGVDEPAMYFFGVARHVLQEYQRRPNAAWCTAASNAWNAASTHCRRTAARSSPPTAPPERGGTTRSGERLPPGWASP